MLQVGIVKRLKQQHTAVEHWSMCRSHCELLPSSGA